MWGSLRSIRPYASVVLKRWKKSRPPGDAGSADVPSAHARRSLPSDNKTPSGNLSALWLRHSRNQMTKSLTTDSAKSRAFWRLGYLVASLGIYLMDQSS